MCVCVCVFVTLRQSLERAQIMRWWNSNLRQCPLRNLGSVTNVTSIYPCLAVSTVFWVIPVTLYVSTFSPFATL